MKYEDKQMVAEYMGWKFWKERKAYIEDWGFDPYKQKVINFDSNDSRLCVEKMVERGDWKHFDLYLFAEGIRRFVGDSEKFLPWLFNPDNFFSAMASWLREGK